MNNDLDRGTNTHGGHVLNDLSAYLDGALGEGDLARVRAHIDACTECRASYLDLSATRTMLRGMPVVPPPRAFTLTEDMLAMKKRERTGFWRLFLSPRNAPRFAMGSALAFVLLVLIVVSDSTILQPSRTSNLTAASMPAAQAPVASGERSGSSSAAGAAPPAAAMATVTTASAALSQAAPQVTMVTRAATQNPTIMAAGAPAAASDQQTAPAPEGTSVPIGSALNPVHKSATPGTTEGQALGNNPYSEPGSGTGYPLSTKVPRAPAPEDAGRTALLGFEIALGVLSALFAVGALLAYRRG